MSIMVNCLEHAVPSNIDCRRNHENGRERIRTDEGDIKIILPLDIDAKLRLETNEGRIRSDFPVSIRRSGDDGEKVNETLGKGLLRVDVFTENGDIILQENRRK